MLNDPTMDPALKSHLTAYALSKGRGRGNDKTCFNGGKKCHFNESLLSVLRRGIREEKETTEEHLQYLQGGTTGSTET